MTHSPSQRLHEALKEIIAGAETGQKLPSEPKLAAQLGVARATLREAMRTFETQGLLYRRQGAGTYVAQPASVMESGLEVLESIEVMGRKIGLQVALADLKIDVRPASQEESVALGLYPDTQVMRVARVIHAARRPAAYLVDVLPLDVLKPEDLDETFTGSVLDLLLERGSPGLASSRTEINAVTSHSDVARALGIQRGDTLLLFTSYLYTTAGHVIDYSFSYFLPGYFRFHVVRRIG